MAKREVRGDTGVASSVLCLSEAVVARACTSFSALAAGLLAG